MHLATIQRILGLLLMMFSLALLPPIGVAWIYDEPSAPPFIVSMLLISGAGAVLWLPVRRAPRDLRLRDGFVIVVAFWLALGITGSVPLLLSDNPDLTLADAVFESVSGLTTTGATVITGLDDLPRAVLFYRHLLQWLGGMGIIVLAVAIAPMLGIGGMQPLSRRNPGTDEGLQADTADHGDRQGSVVPLSPADGHLRSRLLGGRHEPVRRDHPQSFHRCHRRILDPRRESRILRQPTGRAGRHRLHDRRGHEFCVALHRLAFTRLRRLPRGFGAQVLPVDSRRRGRRHLHLSVRLRHVLRPVHRAAHRCVSGGFHQHHDRFHDRELLHLAELPARAAPVRQLHRRLRRLDGRRAEGDPGAAVVQAGNTRNRAPRPPERPGAHQGRRRGHAAPCDRRGLGVLRDLRRHVLAASPRAHGPPVSTRSRRSRPWPRA